LYVTTEWAQRNQTGPKRARQLGGKRLSTLVLGTSQVQSLLRATGPTQTESQDFAPMREQSFL